jgi:[acyl-carrier-protein] S-malonyltransferase
MFEGPPETLMLTENAQPALMAVSLAVLRVLEREGRLDLITKVRFVAGHSLGEYSALAAARAFSLSDAVRLLKRRGQAMQRAVPMGYGAMAALLGGDIETIRSVTAEAAQDEVCAVANDNGGDQVVVSGHRAAVERAIGIASKRGVKRAVLIPVSAPFHCSLMQPAANEMAKALATVSMSDPVIPLISNVKAAATMDAEEIRRLLVEQVTGIVRWRECMLFAKEAGIGRVVEIGAGRVLSGLAKRINREFETASLQGPADIEAFLEKASRPIRQET